MIAALKLTDPSFWALVALAVAAALLMFRSSRYYARQRREEAARSGGMSHARVGMSASDLTHMPTQASSTAPEQAAAHGVASSSEGPKEAGGWEVRMYDTARELSAQLDSKMSALRALAAEADRAAARLEAALQRSDGFGSSQGHQAQSLAGGESRRDDPLPVAPPRAHRHEEIYTLADYGYDAAEIARRVNTPVGEVELILSLRGHDG